MSSFLKVPLMFAAFVILGLAFGYITFNILSFSRTVDVPQLTGFTMVEANEALSKAGLYLKIEGEDFDSTVPTGRILRQDVPAGNKVKEKRVIKVVVSKGPRVSSVPVIVNEKPGDAESVLVQKGLRIGRTIYVHSDTVEKDRIVAQRPGPDEKPEGPITVLVSLGPHELTYYCPDFLGKDIDAARELAAKLGLAAEIKGSGRTVAGQKPKAGAIVNNGDKIYLETKEENTHD